MNLSTREARAKAQGLGDEMLNVLAEIARNTKLPPHDRIAAADKVLDRGYGKPAQQVKAQVTSGRFDWDKVPSRSSVRSRDARLAQRDGIVIEHE